MGLLSILFALAPFGAALIRARQSGDVRMFWMALAGLAAAALIASVAKSLNAVGTGMVAAVTLVVATVAAAAARLAFGGMSVGSVGLWMVAAVFGICFAISTAFLAKLRR